MTWTTTDVLTGLLVVITGMYAALTYGIMAATRRSVRAMEQQTEALSRPYVSILPFVLPGNAIIFLRITNRGKTAAERLRLTLDRPFHQFGEADAPKNLATYAAFSEEITSFAPGAELIFALTSAVTLFADNVDEQKTPRKFRITATYGFGERAVVEPTEVDLRLYRGMHMAFDPIVTALGKICDALKK
jgi:hypothetical protein